jgi:hypothetical protein
MANPWDAYARRKLNKAKYALFSNYHFGYSYSYIFRSGKW